VALQRYVDLTPIALRQREMAMVLARAWSAPVSVISVDAPVSLMPDVQTTAEKLEHFVQPMVEAGIDASTVLGQGRPSKEIRRHVVNVGADLLIIGSHSKRGPLDVGLGSTATALEHDLPATVVMIRPRDEEAAQARELMIPRYPIVFPYG
jgi:nucleotide-binding universal stress UspA family protein